MNLPVAVPVPAAAGLPVEDVVMPSPPFEAKEPALTVPSDDPAVDAQLESSLAPVKKTRRWRGRIWAHEAYLLWYGKDGPFSSWRPAALRQDDVVSILKEVVPRSSVGWRKFL